MSGVKPKQRGTLRVINYPAQVSSSLLIDFTTHRWSLTRRKKARNQERKRLFILPFSFLFLPSCHLMLTLSSVRGRSTDSFLFPLFSFLLSLGFDWKSRLCLSVNSNRSTTKWDRMSLRAIGSGSAHLRINGAEWSGQRLSLAFVEADDPPSWGPWMKHVRFPVSSSWLSLLCLCPWVCCYLFCPAGCRRWWTRRRTIPPSLERTHHSNSLVFLHVVPKDFVCLVCTLIFFFFPKIKIIYQ